ncbi:response regulator [Massilia dura]|uniref:histidine kinase n=1 Tax=Pseudoduganella dura TaxID=321982 RepID=A0A6I3XIZ7_9BURK|nr:hybrid sensor histidine kinase/response regulator [Pseudoduganella dura]MUI14510.1 response regulator [Pseudoduganella dura]GGY16841.1 hypothetical protein GCM10007386_53260 [Pseudoduganella dura]
MPAVHRRAGVRTRRLRLRCAGALRNIRETFTPPAPFHPAALEERFLLDYGHRYAPYRRAASVLAFLLLSAFVVWDYAHYVGDPAFPLLQVLLCRAVILAVTGYTLVRSLQPSFCDDRQAHALMVAAICMTAACELAMVVIVPAAIAFQDYFMSLYVVMIYLYGFLHMRARPVLYTTIAIFAAILGTHAILLPGPRHGLLPSSEFGYAMMFLVHLAVIGVGICIKFERHARRHFLQKCELEQANEESHRKNAQLAQEKEENHIKAQALIRLKDEQRTQALRASQENARFLASASHDLRQPIFGLGLALEAMQRALENGETDEARRLARLSTRSVRAMATTFNAVLDLSRLESGFVAPEPRHFDVCELIREIAADLASFAQSRGVTLRLRLPCAGGIFVYSDRQMLSRIVRNLASNGIKYARHGSPRGAIVLIGAVKLPMRVRLDVVDNGIGIPAQQWQRVFEPFVQLNNPERDRDKGLGLGLSIVNAMIALLPEHRLEFKSGMGRGTRFSLDVPSGCVDGRKDPFPAAGESPPAADLHGLYVIVIEDDPLVRMAMEALLNQWGVLVDAAAGMAQVADLAADLERMPDLIVTDYQFANGVTAVEVLDMLLPHCRSGARRTPVLAVSGEPETARAALAGVAAEVLPKPLQPEQLRAAIARLAGERRHVNCVE